MGMAGIGTIADALNHRRVTLGQATTDRNFALYVTLQEIFIHLESPSSQADRTQKIPAYASNGQAILTGLSTAPKPYL